MKFIDLHAQYQKINSSIDAAIANVMAHGQFIMGPEVSAVESRLADYVGVKHCITMSSGTTALQVALMALEVKPGDEVITSAFSFFGTAEVILLLGATPVFVDIDPATYNMDVTLLEAAITPRTKVIMPVSLYGQCADFDAINKIAQQYDIAVVEDAAQSFGASYREQRSCGLSDIGCTSFFPSKPLGCYGDGGACFTDNDELAGAMRMIMNHGQSTRYHHVRLGVNGRFDTLQAAILLEKLKLFATEVAQRQQVAAWYQQYLATSINIPYVAPGNQSVYAQYTVQVTQRDRIAAALAQQGIPTAVHYPRPLHQQPMMEAHFQQQSFPVAERIAQQVLSLPFYPYLTKQDVQKISITFNQLTTNVRCPESVLCAV